MKRKWILAHMDVAERYAQLSTAQRLQVGCVIVKDQRVVSIGYNGTPAGWDNTCEDEDGNTKPEVIHAEENALMHLAASNESSVGCTLFCTHAPCEHCARLIGNAGIKQVYWRHAYRSTSGLDLLNKLEVYTEQLEL